MASYLAVEALTRNDVENLPKTLAAQKSRDVRLLYPQARWLHLSGLQKAIRRGAVAEAMDSAERLYREDPKKVRRRLAVVAVEDISFGDLVVTATAMTYAASAPKQASEEDLERCLGLVERMASTVKDRIVAEAIGAAVDAPARKEAILGIASKAGRECAALYRDDYADSLDRTVAALVLTGTLTIDGKRIGQRDREGLLASVRSMQLPDAIVLIAELGLRLGGEIAALASIIPVLYHQMSGQDIRIQSAVLPPAELIDGVLSSAYDQHTRSGLRALATYRTHWKPLAEFFRRNVRDPRRGVKTLCFRAEGSVVDREIICHLGDEVFAANEQAQCAAIGLRYSALLEAKHLFIQGLPVLNEFRREAAAAELRAHARGEK